MSCPTNTTVDGCSFAQFLVHQAPKFDQLILEDIRPIESWLGNVSTGVQPFGTPAEVTQDRFRSVYPNTTKVWRRNSPQGIGCTGNPCDPTEHEIGLGADRLTYYPESQTWRSLLLCYDQMIHVTHAKDHLKQYVSKVLKPATMSIASNFLRRRHLLWADKKFAANRNLTEFTYSWTLGGSGGDEERFFDASVAPAQIFKLVPQMLQNRVEPLFRNGYAGENPFKETSPFIELVTDMDTVWFLDKQGGSQGVTANVNPNIASNWRFSSFSAANKYWRYGYSGQIGNYLSRTDMEGLRFNYVGDLGAGVGANRYRYEVVLPYRNVITTGAGGAAGIGSEDNPDYNTAQFRLSQIHHKNGMELLVQQLDSVHPEMPFMNRSLGGKWFFAMDNLVDANGDAIANPRRNKGMFLADFEYWIRPKRTEFLNVFLHKGEQHCIPEIDVCSDDPGYPTQDYSSDMPPCPLTGYEGDWATGVPTGDDAGPLT